MAILMITYISPLEKWGSAKRSHALISALQQHGNVEVLVLNFTDAPRNGALFTVAQWQGVKVMELFVVQAGLRDRPRFDVKSPNISGQVARYVDLAAYDLLVSRYIRPAMKLDLPRTVPLLVDFDDAVYEPPWRALRSLKSWVGVFLRLFNDRIIVRGRLRGARWHGPQFMFCRDAERDVFPALSGAVLPNLPPAAARSGPPDFSPPPHGALMFIGLLDYMPNHDAVDWFLGNVWPLVLQKVPHARFLIVGTGEPARLAPWRQHPQVETLGFVDSLADAYAQATACVVPMRSGAGTNIKALEPYLYGRMIVATPLVVDGHHPLFTMGKDVLVAADAPSFAQHCIDMLLAPERACEIARAGHARITGMLTEARFQAIVDSAVDRLMTPHSAD